MIGNKTGNLGEEIATKYLESKGFTIACRNYRKPWGEIDIVAEKGGVVHFVEVKAVTGDLNSISRESNSYRPEEQIHPMKLRKVIKTAQTYMLARNDDREFQIDAIGVYLDPSVRKARCRMFEQIA